MTDSFTEAMSALEVWRAEAAKRSPEAGRAISRQMLGLCAIANTLARTNHEDIERARFERCIEQCEDREMAAIAESSKGELRRARLGVCSEAGT